jgi:hypothetical protein
MIRGDNHEFRPAPSVTALVSPAPTLLRLCLLAHAPRRASPSGVTVFFGPWRLISLVSEVPLKENRQALL